MVLLTDGRPTVNVDRTLPEANLLLNAGVDVIVVAVGNQRSLNFAELFQISGQTFDNLILTSDWSDFLAIVTQPLVSRCDIEYLYPVFAF